MTHATTPSPRPAELVRNIDNDGRTLFFTTEHGKGVGRCPLQFIRPDLVPAFDGERAWFEVERVRGGSRIVRVLRRVEPPPWAKPPLEPPSAERLASMTTWSTPPSNR